MQIDPQPPVSFDRLVRARFAGCVAYLLITPVFAVIGALAGSGVGLGASALLGGGDKIDGPLMLFFASLGFVLCIWVAVRDYRKRAWDRIVIHADRLEISRGGKPEAVAFDALDWIEGPSLAFMQQDEGLILGSPYHLKLKPRGGALLTLKNEEWPVREIGKALVERAVPAMVAKMTDRIEAGGSCEFRPANLMALRLLFLGTVCLALGGAMLVSWATTSRIEKRIKPLGFSLFLVVTGGMTIRAASRARGGVCLEMDGVRRRTSEPIIPWERISAMKTAAGETTLEIDGEQPIVLGMLVRNYEACVSMLRRRLGVKG